MSKQTAQLFEAFEALPGEAIRELAKKYGVHRRMVRQALESAIPPERKRAERKQPKLGTVKDFIDRILNENHQALPKQRHCASSDAVSTLPVQIREIPGR